MQITVATLSDLIPYILSLLAIIIVLIGKTLIDIYNNKSKQKELEVKFSSLKYERQTIDLEDTKTSNKIKAMMDQYLLEDSSNYKSLIKIELEETKRKLEITEEKLDKTIADLTGAFEQRILLEKRIVCLEQDSSKLKNLQSEFDILKKDYEELKDLNHQLIATVQTKEISLTEKDRILFEKDYMIKRLQDDLEDCSEEVKALKAKVEDGR